MTGADTRAESRAGWAFVTPALLLIGVFFAIPVLGAFVLSFTDFDIYSIADLGNTRIVGLKNYHDLATSPQFWSALRNTLSFVVVGGPLSAAVSLFAAILVNAKLVLTNEPLRRGGGKPHMVEFLYRSGGEVVYVCSQKPNGLTQAQFNAFVSRKPEAKSWHWSTMRRNPSVYVKGRVRHADHATIVLHDWHRVLMNTESQSAAMRHVAFLD